MFDLNAIVSAAISAAITEATKPLLERIATLESANDILHRTQHEDMVAMRDRIAVLEKNEEYLTNRIAALENNPAQGVDTQAPSVLAAQYTPVSNEQVKAALQEWATTGGFVTRDEVAALIEQAMDHHLECYDHDNYDEIASKVDDLPDNLDDYATRDELRSEIEDVLNNATLSLSI